MNPREAYSIIKNGLTHITTSPKSIEANRVMVEALTELERLEERDTAKKPILNEEGTPKCPICSEMLLSYEIWGKIEKFCPECGQRLDWSEDK